MIQPGKLADALTPARVVQVLDRFIVGQEKAKRAVAIALRNRIRRRTLPSDLSEEIAPKNILMVGPTGVGKTEIARRLASLVDSPFIKVEATKFTEVGYVGRDVESMIRDLVESAIQMVKVRRMEEIQPQARVRAEERLLDSLLPRPRKEPPDAGAEAGQARGRTGRRVAPAPVGAAAGAARGEAGCGDHACGAAGLALPLSAP